MGRRDAATPTLYISVTRASTPELVRDPKTGASTKFELKSQAMPVSLLNVTVACCSDVAVAAAAPSAGPVAK